MNARKLIAVAILLVLVACASPEQTPEPVTRKTLPPTWTDGPTSIPSQTQEPLTKTPESPIVKEEQITETPRPNITNLPATNTVTPNVQETDYVTFWEQHSTPMGDGFLADHLLLGPHASELMHNFRGSSDPWFTGEVEGRMSIIVYAGVYQADQQQGKLIVVRKGTIWGFFGDHIDLPARSGRPEIIDAVGKRLIIETEMGDIFYFDVPSGKFASSLNETLATMTPGPTLTPGVTAIP